MRVIDSLMTSSSQLRARKSKERTCAHPEEEIREIRKHGRGETEPAVVLGKVSDPESFEHDDWYQTEQRPVREANRDGRDG